MKTQIKILLVIAFSVLVFGCSNTNTENVKTSGFYVTFSVNANNVGTAICRAYLQVGGPTGTYLDLSSGDTLTCDGAPMARSEFAGMITYSANVTYTVGKTYNVVLSRPGEGDYTSSVVLPAPVAGYNPAAPATYQKGTVISPTWTPSADPSDVMYVTLSYNYGTGSRSVLKTDSAPENGGGVSFDATETQMTPASPGIWSGSINFSRSRSGTVANGLSGRISATQDVSTTITLQD